MTTSNQNQSTKSLPIQHTAPSANGVVKLIEDIGQQFLREGVFKIPEECKKTAVEVGLHFMRFDDGQPIGLYGPNGVGKSFLFKIMKVIAPYFKFDFGILDCNDLDNAETAKEWIDEYKSPLRAKDLEDIGGEKKFKVYGNEIDVVSTIVNAANKRYENGHQVRVYFTTNLNSGNYGSFGSRYGKRLLDRLGGICRILPYGTNVSSFRGKSRPCLPNPKEIHKIMMEFFRNELGFNFNTELDPYTYEEYDQRFKELEQWFKMAKGAKNYMEYVAYYNNLESRLNTLSEDIKDNELVFNEFKERLEVTEKFVRDSRVRIKFEEKKVPGSGTKLRDKMNARCSDKNKDDAERAKEVQRKKAKALKVMKRMKREYELIEEIYPETL